MESLDTIELTITLNPVNPWTDIIIAELSELGFDGFVSTKTGLQAYASATVDVDKAIQASSLQPENDFTFSIEKKIIPHQNWNAQWEEDFHPVYVEDYATILAPFHDMNDGKGLTVIIQPQMSFGTGHHQTTWMMTKALFEMDQLPENVLDMGAGTGVLAIVAEKLGAKKILAVDIEEWSAENARENAERNNCQHIDSVWGDVDKIRGRQFGLIIANINKNVLKTQMKDYAKCLNPNGTLLLSGFFGSDVQELVTFTKEFGLTLEKEFSKDEWAALQLKKTN